jgi:flagellar biogenesis protein FliO
MLFSIKAEGVLVKKIIILILGVFLFGANLINVNFFESQNKLDVLFSLDSAFTGKVKQISKNSYILTDITTNSVIQKEFTKNFVNSIIISPDKNGVRIDITANKPVKTSVALTPDGYGVRFRIINEKPVHVQKIKPGTNNFTANDRGLDTVSYIVGLSVLIILAFVLWFLKRKTASLPSLRENMKVLAQKPVDAKNKIVLFEYQDRKYLMLIGNTNVLLDVFADDVAVPKNEVEFDEILKLSKKYNNIDKYIQNAEKLKEFDERI